jgi:hypothetical protein
VYRPLAADVVPVDLPEEEEGERESVAVVGTAVRDVLVDETTAEEEDFNVDGTAGWRAVLVLVLVLPFPGETPPGNGETEVGAGFDPPTPVPVPGTGITVTVGLAPVTVTVYTTVPVTTASVVV